MALEPLTATQIEKAAAWLDTWKRAEPSPHDPDAASELRGFVMRRRDDGIAIVTAHFIERKCSTCGGTDADGGVVALNPGERNPWNVDTDDCPDHRLITRLAATTSFYRPDGWITDEKGQPL